MLKNVEKTMKINIHLKCLGYVVGFAPWNAIFAQYPWSLTATRGRSLLSKFLKTIKLILTKSFTILKCLKIRKPSILLKRRNWPGSLPGSNLRTCSCSQCSSPKSADKFIRSLSGRICPVKYNIKHLKVCTHEYCI